MIDKIENNQIQDLLAKALTNRVNPAQSTGNIEADASLQVNYAALISTAMLEPADDTEVVQAAKELLLSGKLDTPENIREAADNIITYGI